VMPRIANDVKLANEILNADPDRLLAHGGLIVVTIDDVLNHVVNYL